MSKRIVGVEHNIQPLEGFATLGAADMKRWIPVAALAISGIFCAFPVAAQPNPSGLGLIGPGMMDWPSMGRTLCDPSAAGLAKWQLSVIERAVQPTNAQRPLLEALKSASNQATDTIAKACPRALPQSPVGRLEVLEQRLGAMLDAVKTVRPAFESFYSSLSDQQKARFARAAPRRWGWGSWHWPWEGS